MLTIPLTEGASGSLRLKIMRQPKILTRFTQNVTKVGVVYRTILNYLFVLVQILMSPATVLGLTLAKLMEMRVPFSPQAAQEMVPRLKRMPQVQVIRASHLIRCQIEHLTRYPEL